MAQGAVAEIRRVMLPTYLCFYRPKDLWFGNMQNRT